MYIYIICADGKKMGVRFHLLTGMSIFQKQIDSHDKNVGKARPFVGSDFCLHSGRKFSKWKKRVKTRSVGRVWCLFSTFMPQVPRNPRDGGADCQWTLEFAGCGGIPVNRWNRTFFCYVFFEGANTCFRRACVFFARRRRRLCLFRPFPGLVGRCW